MDSLRMDEYERSLTNSLTVPPFFKWGPPHKKQPPPVVDVPPELTEPVPPNPPVVAVVSWSNRCVYFVRPRFPKFLTCMTLGNSDTSTVDSVASV